MSEPMLYGILTGLAVALLVALYDCFFIVSEGHMAVVDRFGEVERTGTRLKLRKPGLHFKYPWERVHMLSTMEQTLDLSGESGGRVAMTQDGTLLRIDSKLRFKPEQEGIYSYLFELKNPLEHIKGLFTCLLRNEIANFKSSEVQTGDQLSMSSYALIRRERRLLNQKIETFCRERIGASYGVRFDAVDMTDILPPDELEEALNAVFNAQTEAETLFARSEAECRQRIIAAERGVKIAESNSQAAQIEITTLGKFLRELKNNGMLSSYVERRKNEVYSESRALFVKRSS